MRSRHEGPQPTSGLGLQAEAALDDRGKVGVPARAPNRRPQRRRQVAASAVRDATGGRTSLRAGTRFEPHRYRTHAPDVAAGSWAVVVWRSGD